MKDNSCIFDQTASSMMVSVIIPTYNRACFIGEAIHSVLTQTYTNLEVLVVDDGSIDNTKSIIESIFDPRVHYIYQPNRGRSSARNKALSLAKGKFIAFLDSDDLYHLPNKIELQVNYLIAHPGTGMVYTSAYCINEQGERLQDKYEAFISGLIYKDIAFFTPVTITLPTVMTYRSVIDHVGHFDEMMHRFEDTDMWRRISKSYRIDAMSEYSCLLRTHSGNTLCNQNPDHIIRDLKYYASKILSDDTDINLAIRNSGLACLYRYYAAALMSVSKFSYKGTVLMRIAENYESNSKGSPAINDNFFQCAHYPLMTILYKCFSKIKNIFGKIRIMLT